MNKDIPGFYVALIISQIWFASGETIIGTIWVVVSTLALIIYTIKEND